MSSGYRRVAARPPAWCLGSGLSVSERLLTRPSWLDTARRRAVCPVCQEEVNVSPATMRIVPHKLSAREP